MPRMTTWNRLFKDHPESVGETYWQHFSMAMGFGLRMIGGGLACIAHAVIPGAFCTTGSESIRELHDRMVVNRRRMAGAGAVEALQQRRAA